jgi:hypothetical protein
MAVNIYDELLALSARLTTAEAKTAALEARVAKLETPPVVKPPVQLAVVSYLRDALLWDKIIAAKPVIAMINPGSGPGTSADSLYVGLVPKVKTAGINCLGYIHSKGTDGVYGNRPMSEIKRDIDLHVQFYAVNGIFCDTVNPTLAYVPYYAEMCAYAHAKGLKICLNPGTKCLEDHVKMADWVMCVETYATTYLAGTRPLWEKNYPGKLWHCVHTAAPAQLQSIYDKARRDGAGLLTVTDDVMPNPYNTLPSYWSELCRVLTTP